MDIRLAQTEELPLLRAIEDRAGRLYGSVGIDPNLPGLSLNELAVGRKNRLLWVLTEKHSAPVAFALCSLHPEALHLLELDVEPQYARRGLGACLVEHVVSQAEIYRVPCVSLTTFAEVPWNAPYYERLGFSHWSPESLPAWLAEIRRHEVSAGLDTWPRTVMRHAVRRPQVAFFTD